MQQDKDKLLNDLTAANKNSKLQLENLFVCDDCGEKFRDENSLTAHILLDHEEKVFKCAVCERNCRTEDDLKVHKKIDHSN